MRMTKGTVSKNDKGEDLEEQPVWLENSAVNQHLFKVSM